MNNRTISHIIKGEEMGYKKGMGGGGGYEVGKRHSFIPAFFLKTLYNTNTCLLHIPSSFLISSGTIRVGIKRPATPVPSAAPPPPPPPRSWRRSSPPLLVFTRACSLGLGPG